MKHDIHLGYYSLLFMDVLGQRSLLRELRELPENGEDKKRVVGILRDTLGVVTGLREAFNTYLTNISQESEYSKGLRPALRDELRSLRVSDIRYQHFSDSIIILVPLTAPDEEVCKPIIGVQQVIGAACAMQRATLFVGKTLRGGVDVGLATEMESGEVYGPALERAYHLESALAEYPRVLIGKELLDYLQSILDIRATTPRQKAFAYLAQSCRGMVMEDEDGLYALDYMGSTARKLHNIDDLRAKEVFTKIDKFVTEQWVYWKQQKNLKLARRYAWLKRYIDSRSSVWI